MQVVMAMGVESSLNVPIVTELDTTKIIATPLMVVPHMQPMLFKLELQMEILTILPLLVVLQSCKHPLQEYTYLGQITMSLSSTRPISKLQLHCFSGTHW